MQDRWESLVNFNQYTKYLENHTSRKLKSLQVREKYESQHDGVWVHYARLYMYKE